MKLPIEGGCACGAVRYESRARPIATLKCHCRDCQRISGNPHVCAVLFPADAFRFTRGHPSYFCTPSEAGGQHKRGFCPVCGSRLTGGESPDTSSVFVGVTVGSLDDASWFKPDMEIWIQDAQPWDRLLAGVPQFAQNPPPG